MSQPRPRASSDSTEGHATPALRQTPSGLLQLQTPSRSSSLAASPDSPLSPQIPSRSRSEHSLATPTRLSPQKAFSNLRSMSQNHASIPTSHSAQDLSNNSSRYGARNMAFAMDKLESRPEAGRGDLNQTGVVGYGGADEWQSVVVRTLPLFNKEGVKGYIEDLNELVTLYTRRVAERAPGKAIQHLSRDLSLVLEAGMVTLRDKLISLQGDKLLARLNDTWVFFFSSILPYLEAIFLPFSTDARLLRATVHQSQQPQGPLAPQAIQVRRLALKAFRDEIVLSFEVELEELFSNVAPRPPLSRSTSATLETLPRASPEKPKPNNANADVDPEEQHGRRMQMVALLCSVHTDDDNQAKMQILSRALRGLTRSEAYRDSASTYREGSVLDRSMLDARLQNLRSRESLDSDRSEGSQRC